tara:strand:+ start:657 stop:995 length:339 start_codon:yes stop_codon:yes gene_type:complete
LITDKELKEIKKLALDYRANLVFTSWDCYHKNPNIWCRNLQSVFMPLLFGCAKKEHTFFYMYFGERHQFDRSANGFPMFDKVYCWNKEKEDKLREILIALEGKDKEVLEKIE